MSCDCGLLQRRARRSHRRRNGIGRDFRASRIDPGAMATFAETMQARLSGTQFPSLRR